MNDDVVCRLAVRLLKCPLCNELCDAALSLRQHLLEHHVDQIRQMHRIPREEVSEETERPSIIYICGHCFRFMVPKAPDRNALSEIPAHIRREHVTPSCQLPGITLFCSTDPNVIDDFVSEQGLREMCVCSHLDNCGKFFSDSDAVAMHWAEDHAASPTVADVMRGLETDPQCYEKLGSIIAEVLAELATENERQIQARSNQDDGYRIRHMPDVPRVRSRPSELVVYLEREAVRLPESEFLELLEAEGFDLGPIEEWAAEWNGQLACSPKVEPGAMRVGRRESAAELSP